MIDVKEEILLTKEEVFNLLNYFDDSSECPLHNSLDFDSYSIKLSKYAKFILAYSSGQCVGFIAYYLNNEGKFIYIPQFIVHKSGRHQGVGHCMFSALLSKYATVFNTARLEVLKANKIARRFYLRENFDVIEDRGERILLEKEI